MKLDGTKIKRGRLVQGWSQTMLARQAGVTEQTALRAEKGREVTPQTARKLASALDTTVVDLWNEDEQ
jgi:DNA-binding XRE family transcriptional regulator